jgi:hypothetical protein
MQAVHEQPEFAQLLAAAESGSTELSGLGVMPTGDDLFPVSSTGSGNEIPSNAAAVSDDLRKAFNDFVGQTFFSELIKSYRSTQQPAAYFNGGRAEKIFQGQLDQMFAEELSERSADKIAEPMFEQFKVV